MDFLTMRLKEEMENAERRHREACRRVEWLEKYTMESNTHEEFEKRNAETEYAIKEREQFGLQALIARKAYACEDRDHIMGHGGR